MKKVKWEMKERFIFPAFAGLPIGAETVSVTPRFTEERDDDAVRLTGIYHIAANVSFSEEGNKSEMTEEAILIEDVELDGQTGYFEYAVPLNVDLPAEAGDPLNVAVVSSSFEVDGQGVCGVVWDVECSYKKAVVLEEPVVELESEQKEKEVVAKAVAVEEATAILNNSTFSDEDEVLSFIFELGDGFSATTFRSNDVFVEREG